MNVATRFLSYIEKNELFTSHHRLLIAVSGGVDSMVLCRLCQLAGFTFGMAHCNFQLRGEDSLADERFVQKWAAHWEVPFYSIRFDTVQYASAHKCSTQVAARNLRYEWFETIRTENGFDYLLTAHHADDNMETLLMHFFRGTGINGLTGIKVKNGVIRRPLLFAFRQELEDFLKSEGLDFVQDISNFSDDYTRNFFRNRLIPQIAQVFPEVRTNLIKNIYRMEEVQQLYQQSINFHKKKLLLIHGQEWKIPVLLLLRTAPVQTVLFEIIRDFGFTSGQVQDVLALTRSETGRFVKSATHQIVRDRKHLILAPLATEARARVLVEGPGSFPFQGNQLLILEEGSRADWPLQTDSQQGFLDLRDIHYPLVLRPWRTGDYFYPLGMPKKKKLSRFLIDLKLSKTEKEKVWVLTMNRTIIWVLGYRIDHRFRITDSTTQILHAKLG